ncbi:leucine-rich repeat protein [Plasmodium vinckei]|uniref:Leucine-rich repeat-containing protein 51 n=1 Tax=Plasmodium vinckei TaxID=5860 RepID=A0A6V7TCT6_PLAVN|nr:leucine-rich repeat protein [Plasmodium vinckei]
MDHMNTIELSYKDYGSVCTFSPDNDSLNEESNDELNISERKKNLSDNLSKDENNRVEKYIKLENTKKIWAGTNEIIFYKKKDLLELSKIIYKYDDDKEINVSSNSKVLNLNNNNLTHLDFLNDLLNHIYKSKNLESSIIYSNIISLDISFNNLTLINNDILMLNNLQVLYLHSNKIENINEIQKLQTLSNLKKLTLENNPLVNIYNKFYRLNLASCVTYFMHACYELYMYVCLYIYVHTCKRFYIPNKIICRSFIIHYLPQIKSLDFQEITKIEKNKAGIGFNMHKYKFNLE